MSFKVLHQEGDSSCFYAALGVVYLLLEGGGTSSELTNFCLDDSLLFFTLLIVHDFSMGFPHVQLIRCLSKDIESCTWAAQQLEKPLGHGFNRDA